MEKKKFKKYITIIFLFLLVFTIFISLSSSASAEEKNEDIIYVDYYYPIFCNSCIELRDNVIIKAQDDLQNETVIFRYKTTGEYSDEAGNYRDRFNIDDPFVVIKNNTGVIGWLDQYNISVDNIRKVIHGIPVEGGRIDIDLLFWHVSFFPSDYSLPVLAIILGGLDSFNPCAFFILIFLLNLLIYVKSRKRMILIGGIFIFFSGFFYMIFMFFLLEILKHIQTEQNILIISLLVACIVLPLGFLNIKDFFFFKKGASLSIPDDKKRKIYKLMRNVVRNPKISGTLIGTIILAATVNFYELLCTLGLPFVFVKALSDHHIAEGSGSYYMYIVLYNIVYVIPLIIIVLIFVLTLGRRKLSEWHGQIMKLMSGIMLFGFGILMLIDHKLLSIVFVPIFLLIFSIVSTFTISFLWKKFKLDKQD